MKHLRKLILTLTLLALLLTSAAGCGRGTPDDIYIFFTGDTHCSDDENIGFAGVKALVDQTRETKSRYVTLVDTGDAIWGDFLGNNSEGAYIIDLMNRVGYDYAVLGNHEFDYGMEQLSVLLEQANATYLGCNLTYTGRGETPLTALQPWAMERYGGTQVAYIGVSTPQTLTDSTPTNFMENGEFVYDFGHGDAEGFYATVQTQINACREAGADYVILLTHLGDGEEYGAFSSEALIAATSGADAVLDGHAHSTIPCRMTANKEGLSIPLASTGTGLNNVGQLVITPSGNLTVTLLHGEGLSSDGEVDALIAAENEKVEGIMSQVVGHSNFELPTHDANGIRMVRNQETALGNFCTDAYRATTGADIAFANGGGLRAPLPQGDITFGDIMALQPFGNNICVAYATGQEIADAMEFSARYAALDENGKPTGENGSFFHVSGLRFTVDTSIPSTVVTDEAGMFASVAGERRVKDLQVETAEGWKPLERNKIYTVASFNYILQECGSGCAMFADNEFLLPLGKFDYETILDYLNSFGGEIPARYASTEGRIIFK